MFYSHTFLAKKSPLGTVWIAAHLERRIKKHQLDEIDIPSYANCIMYPEVPIALRLSGHLLYGLVKIYSLKVKYLFQDCTRIRDDVKTVYTMVQVDLPIDADQAPYDSITLPHTFNLDAMELDDDNLGGPDRNLVELDEITIQDQISVEREQYISISINEGINDSTPRINYPNQGLAPIEEDPLPQNMGQPDDSIRHMETDIIASGSGLGYNMEKDDIFPPYEDEPGDLDPNELLNQPIEIRRDVAHNYETNQVPTNNFIEDIEQSIHSTTKKSLSPIIEDQSASGEGSFQSLARDSLGTVPLEPDNLATGSREISLGPQSHDIQIQPSPFINQREKIRRKRKQYFDEAIVLNNVEMKKQLQDPSKLVCKRKKLPCSVLDVWKFNRLSKNEKIFHEPLITGMHSKLQELSEKNIPPSRSLSTSLEASNEQINAEDQYINAQDRDNIVTEMDEAENIRHDTDINRTVNDALQSTPATIREESTPINTDNYGSISDKGNTIDTEVLPSSENTAFANVDFPELRTPFTNFDDQLHFDDSNRDFPTLQNSVDVEETNFLEASNISSRYDISNIDTMPATTKKFANYLNEQSPAAQTPDQPGLINLNKILENKQRKQCAKMFFETLVLKCYNVIDVQQKEDYGDILISMNPCSSSKLST